MKYLVILLILIHAKFSFGAAGVYKSSNDFLFSGNFEFVDLSHSFDKESVYWPGHQNFTFVKKDAGNRPDGSWYAANEFCAGEHGGTHLDAPYHFARDGVPVADIPMDKLILPLIIVDISDQVRDNPSFVLEKFHLDYMLNNYFGRLEQPCLVVFKFGWSKFYHDREKYLGLKGDNLNFPGLSGEVAQWIASSYKNVAGVGVDTASVDAGAAADLAAHKILTAAGLYVLENVKLDQYIPEALCTALVLPMKISRGTGAPLRLVAICPKHHMNPTTLHPHRL